MANKITKKTWVYDLEVLNIFTATFRDETEKRVFVITADEDDRNQLFDFLNHEVAGLIGYNCITYDSQILEYLYRNPKASPADIRRYSDVIVGNNDRRPDVPEWKLRIPHLDLFKALSLSVKAKRTGLKWCEFGMDLENIEDMPSQGEGGNWKEMVLSYNDNDVIATQELYKRYYHEIELRKSLTRSEGVNLLNSTEPDMAKKLFCRYLSIAMGIPENDLRSMQTRRDIVYVKDIIFPYVTFKTDKFKQVMNAFEKLELRENEDFAFTIKYQGIDIDYGLGGLHAAPKNTIIESSDTHDIRTLDATSYYPHLCFQNGLHPNHLPKDIFLDLYKGFYLKRKVIPKTDPKNYILKILLNASYGLMNDEFSFLRDRLVGLAICVNGQLLLSMLVEKMTMEIPDSRVIMINTDGAEFLIPKDKKDKYDEICKWWEDLTTIPLEHDMYSKLIISDVNNYISIYTNGKTKCKGKFEFQNIPLHKNKSHNIIPKAIYEYFVNDIPIETTIRNHRNIFDFCAGVKSSSSDKKGKSRYELHSVVNGMVTIQKLSKTVRYFISNRGGYIIKRFEDKTFAQVEAPIFNGRYIVKEWKVTYFNKSYKVDDFAEYNIDYSYYISKAREIIGALEQKDQLKLL